MTPTHSIHLTQNIWAVGRNYAAHAKEMNAPIPTQPIIFLKSGNCLNPGSVIRLPTWSNDVHYELELAFLLDDNLNFSHVSLALDLTARDAQDTAKKSGQPWTLAKSFSESCPVGSWVSLLDAGDIDSLQFVLYKNKKPVQTGFAKDMIFKPAQLLQFISNRFPVSNHDVVLTGTPEGIGRLQAGDLLQAELIQDRKSLLSCQWDVL